MGFSRERAGKDGKSRWTAYYLDIQGRERSAGTFATERAADRAWHAAEIGIGAGRVGDPRRGKQKVRRYVQQEWFPQHHIEENTREVYTYLLDRYILPELGSMRMIEVLPFHVREWVGRMRSVHLANPPTIAKAKVIIDAIFTTALNDQITFLHPGKGVKTPHVVTKPRRIITAAQFEKIYASLDDPTIRMLVETDIETGLRWGELTELRPKDIDFTTGVLTVARVVVHLKAKDRPIDSRFMIKEYPKDREWRQVKLAPHLLRKIEDHVDSLQIADGDLLFELRQDDAPSIRRRPLILPDPATLGHTTPNDKGRTYPHGTPTAYQAGKCRCQYCRDSVAAYRAQRRSQGKDAPRTPRKVVTDGHIPNDWFRNNPWRKALATADLGFRVTPHGLRHAHASWLLAGGADIQVVKERLGHGTIRTTERYLHTLPDAGDEALKALAAIRGRGVPAESAPTTTDPGRRRSPKKGRKNARKTDNGKGMQPDLKKLLEMVSELVESQGDPK